MRSVNFLISTFFGIGKLPLAPGTWASLAAAPCFWPLVDKPLILVGVLIVIYFGGVYFTSEYEKQIGQKDPSSAVIDEVLGVGVAPAEGARPSRAGRAALCRWSGGH